jgi:hypothetical protein
MSLTLAFVVAAGFLGPFAVAGDEPGQATGRKEASNNAMATPDEHLARATAYQEKAAAYREEAAVHRRMLAEFTRKEGNPAQQSKAGRELPWIAQMRKHCESYIADAERLAADAESFADFHRKRAAELQAK